MFYLYFYRSVLKDILNLSWKTDILETSHLVVFAVFSLKIWKHIVHSCHD